MTTQTLHRTAALAALVLAVSACSAPAPEPSDRPVPAAGERFTVRPSPVTDLKPVAAVVATRDMAEARARIPGVLVELKVRPGDKVGRGQVIGRVVDQRLGLETRAYDAQIAAASAENTRAQADLARTRDLFEKGVYAKARLEQMEAAARGAAANVAAARAQRGASAELGAQGTILAPAAGRVIKADIPAGSAVSPGQSIATIAAGEPLLRLDLPEAQARTLRVGQALPVDPDEAAGIAGAAVVRQVYPSAEAGRVRVDAALPGLAAALIGQRVQVRTPVGQRQALVIPARFVVSRYGVDYVRLVGEGGAANEVPVQLARGGPAGQVEALSGLSAGDVLVAAGPAR